MSRRVTMDHAPDKKLFISLLKKVQGKRTLNQFASDSGINRNSLSRYFNSDSDLVPVPDTIFKLHKASDGQVSLSDLLDAAGYDPGKYTDAAGAGHTEELLSFQRMTGIILADLANRNVHFAIDPDEVPDSTQVLAVQIEKPERVLRYYWRVPHLPDDDSRPLRLLAYYGLIVVSSLKPGSELYLVTADERIFQLLESNRPGMLAFSVSALLIDPVQFTIKSETLLTAGRDSR